MNRIPKRLNDELNEDPFYKTCCLASDGMCSGRVERHHALIFAGRQLQKKFAILPACQGYHHRFANRKDIKERFDWILLNRATDEELTEISKAINYKEERLRLNKIYGEYKPKRI